MNNLNKPLTLTKDEIKELLKQDPATGSDGGFQSLMVLLQKKLKVEITLSADELEKIPRYAFDYNNGGWESRLKKIFSRVLGENLGRQLS